MGFVDEVERGPVGELCVGLVDDDQARCKIEELTNSLGRLDETGRVVRRREEHDVRAMFGEHPLDFGGIEREVGGALALHEGRPLHRLDWADLRRIEVVEYLGNTRYKLVHGEDEEYLVVESEIEDGEALVDEAFALSGIPRQSAPAGEALSD